MYIRKKRSISVICFRPHLDFPSSSLNLLRSSSIQIGCHLFLTEDNPATWSAAFSSVYRIYGTQTMFTVKCVFLQHPCCKCKYLEWSYVFSESSLEYFGKSCKNLNSICSIPDAKDKDSSRNTWVFPSNLHSVWKYSKMHYAGPKTKAKAPIFHSFSFLQTLDWGTFHYLWVFPLKSN